MITRRDFTRRVVAGVAAYMTGKPREASKHAHWEHFSTSVNSRQMAEGVFVAWLRAMQDLATQLDHSKKGRTLDGPQFMRKQEEMGGEMDLHGESLGTLVAPFMKNIYKKLGHPDRVVIEVFVRIPSEEQLVIIRGENDQ